MPSQVSVVVRQQFNRPAFAVRVYIDPKEAEQYALQQNKTLRVPEYHCYSVPLYERVLIPEEGTTELEECHNV